MVILLAEIGRSDSWAAPGDIETPYVLPRTVSMVDRVAGGPSPCDGRKSEDVTGSGDPAEVSSAIEHLCNDCQAKKD